MLIYPHQRGLIHATNAAAALEFAIVSIPFLMFLFAILYTGLVEFYQLTFDEAVRNAARQIQIDGPAASSGAGFIAAVCSEFSTVAPNCTATVTYNIQGSAPTSGFATLTPVTLPTSGVLGNVFFSGTAQAQNVNVLVQAAYKLPFVIPFFSAVITSTGTTSILATTSLRVEPY